MDENYRVKLKKNFRSICLLHLAFHINIGLYSVNIQNLLLYLPGTTPFGIGLAASIGLFVGTISIILFGYYSDMLSERFSRKKIFFFTNLCWVIGFSSRALAPNYYFFLIGVGIAAFGGGAFLPIGYSIIGDS